VIAFPAVTVKPLIVIEVPDGWLVYPVFASRVTGINQYLNKIAARDITAALKKMETGVAGRNFSACACCRRDRPG
jgi:hypothetical protein